MKHLLAVFILLASPIHAFAEAVYPAQLPLRLLGADQVSEGSCASEAQTGAFEQYFSNLGWPVELSSFYRHAKNWQATPEKDIVGSVHLKFSDADRAILQANGGVLPNYMWPEDLALIRDKSDLGEVRPSVSAQAVIDPAYPSGTADGYQAQQFTFTPGYSNSSSVEAMKGLVRQALPVTLSLQADILGYAPGSGTRIFNQVTGLMQIPYETVRDGILKQEVNHAVSVVGFDDELGAFIIRNSWNSTDAVVENIRSIITDPVILADLAKMKSKLSPINLPGYFALPYAYVNDLAASQKGGYSAQTMNYAFFFSKYDEFKPRYRVFTLPYTCHRDLALRFLEKYKQLKAMIGNSATTPERMTLARQQLYRMLQDQTFLGKRLFNFAKVSFNSTMPTVDRVAEFYAGRFKDYYCGEADTQMFPQAGDFTSNLTGSDHPVWLDKVSNSQTQFTLWDEIFGTMLRERKF